MRRAAGGDRSTSKNNLLLHHLNKSSTCTIFVKKEKHVLRHFNIALEID
jgi:hypothetical protein